MSDQLSFKGFGGVFDFDFDPGLWSLPAEAEAVASDAEAAREEAIDRAEAHADTGWLDRAYAVVVALARRRGSFTTDDVLRELGDDMPREPRVVGAVMRRAKRDGVVEPHGYAPSSRVESHARPKRVWASRVRP